MVAGGYYAIAGRWSMASLIAGIPYGLGIGGLLVAKHIDQRAFDLQHHQRTLPVLIGPKHARALCRVVLVAMYVLVFAGVAVRLLPHPALVIVTAVPRASRSWGILSRPAPEAPPPGFVGWPLWFHRALLKHTRAFGWLLILGLAIGAA